MGKLNSQEPQISRCQTHSSPLPGWQHPDTCRSLATVAKQKTGGFSRWFASLGSWWVDPAATRKGWAKMETQEVICLCWPVLTAQRWAPKQGCCPPSEKIRTTERFTWREEVSPLVCVHPWQFRRRQRGQGSLIHDGFCRPMLSKGGGQSNGSLCRPAKTLIKTKCKSCGHSTGGLLLLL